MLGRNIVEEKAPEAIRLHAKLTPGTSLEATPNGKPRRPRGGFQFCVIHVRTYATDGMKILHTRQLIASS